MCSGEHSLSLRRGKAELCSAPCCSYGPFAGATHPSFSSLHADEPAMTKLPQSSPGTVLSALSTALLFSCLGFVQCGLPNFNHLMDLPLALSSFQALIPTPELYFPAAAKAHSCFLCSCLAPLLPFRRVALHKRQLPNPRGLHHTHICNQLHMNQDLR